MDEVAAPALDVGLPLEVLRPLAGFRVGVAELLVDVYVGV